MGIIKGNELCAELRKESLLTGSPMQEAILYVDGLILLFCGNVIRADNPNIPAIDRALMIVNAKLMRLYNTLQKKFIIKKIIIVFDGIAPKEKQKTQQKRRQNSTSMVYNIDELKDEFTNRYKNSKIFDTQIEVRQCEGEAELCIYLKRDVKFNSIIYTKDTDFFMIGYSHVPKCSTDYVYMCNEIISRSHSTKRINTLEIYDMSKFVLKNLSREWFQLIMALCGTDYTRTIFTTTMTKELLQKIKDSQINGTDFFAGLNVPSNYDRHKIGDKLFTYLNILKLSTKHRECANRQISNDDIENLLWYLNYLNVGNENVITNSK
jgi:hypothetical protein